MTLIVSYPEVVCHPVKICYHQSQENRIGPYRYSHHRRGRFGPDVEWIDQENYDVPEAKRGAFAAAVQRYWPACRADTLHAAYSGIRPKICAKGAPDADFYIMEEKDHGVPGVMALLGIESPGITSSLALADIVREKINQQR